MLVSVLLEWTKKDPLFEVLLSASREAEGSCSRSRDGCVEAGGSPMLAGDGGSDGTDRYQAKEDITKVRTGRTKRKQKRKQHETQNNKCNC